MLREWYNIFYVKIFLRSNKDTHLCRMAASIGNGERRTMLIGIQYRSFLELARLLAVAVHEMYVLRIECVVI